VVRRVIDYATVSMRSYSVTSSNLSNRCEKKSRINKKCPRRERRRRVT